MQKQASVIDVYDIEENAYKFSFYVYHIGKEKLKTFQVLDDKFIGMIGDHIITYQLSTYRFNKLKPEPKEGMASKQHNQDNINNTAVRDKAENL